MYQRFLYIWKMENEWRISNLLDRTEEATAEKALRSLYK